MSLSKLRCFKEIFSVKGFVIWNRALGRFHVFVLFEYTLSLRVWWVLDADVTLVNRKIWVLRGDP